MWKGQLDKRQMRHMITVVNVNSLQALTSFVGGQFYFWPIDRRLRLY